LYGVSVRLLGSHGVQIASTYTDGSGNYTFSNVDPGDYQVQFVTPADHVLTEQFQGEDTTLDSDADTGTWRTDTLTVDRFEAATHVDAGLISTLSSISGRVWNDADEDGIQDEGETGYSGASVRLIDS